ncbi:MAG: 16S rRNA (cytidine(1402)-2'-O)-methyltransferase [Epulopiscium sp.]|nr:16S rRNA (cytidine(1402)-2'-O)-methyltransferase [Candidatus Epulonipiscium sp.]
MHGTLYLCATPIGNLEDITLRVLRILKEVDLIAAEDTRRTQKLLNHYEIETPSTSYHEHNKQSKGQWLLEQLKAGKNIALVTDAGTPGISDPGADLVLLCYKENIPVTSLPGAVAGITGLILSGLSTKRFAFEGFLPSDNKKKKEILKFLSDETRTILLYEAPHRLRQTLKELSSVIDVKRKMTLARELTKKHEEIFRTTLGQAIDYYQEQEPRGEYVILIEGKSLKRLQKEEQQTWNTWSILEHMQFYLDQGISVKEAMKRVAKDRGVPKREVYATWHQI